MNIAQLKQWKNENKIAIYCAGTHGREIKKLLKFCGVEIDYFLDNNKNLQGKMIDGVICYKPTYIEGKNNCITLIAAGLEKYEEIYRMAKKQGILNIIDFRLVLDDLIIHNDLYTKLMYIRSNSVEADLFYTKVFTKNENINRKKIKEKKIAVYTANFGNYDKIFVPEVVPENVDYYYFSDAKPLKLKRYIWRDAKKYIPDAVISPIKRNRYLKMHPDELFPEYEYSIYLDSNIKIIGDITDFFGTSKSGISVFKHNRRDCLFYEAMTIVNYKRAIPQDVVIQMNRYLEEGMPLHFGLMEMPIIAREHKNKYCKKIMNLWWEEFNKGAQRDQLSFMYSVWKNGMTIDDIAILGDDVRMENSITIYNHIKQSKYIANEDAE